MTKAAKKAKTRKVETKKGKPAEPPKYPPPFEYRFRAGPYVPPAVNVGATMYDECVGEVKVVGMSDAPIPWPAYACSAGRRVGPMPVLTGALVRAVCEEEEGAVAHYWGVSPYMVNRWKCAIAKAKNSNVVAVNIALLRRDPEFRKRYGYHT